MQKITANAYSVKHLLGQKYKIDAYQREYKWTKRQITDLVEDLTGVFARNYKEAHARTDVERYEQYFMGPIIVSEGEQQHRYIVDGQQRLASLTLILIALNNSDAEGSETPALEHLICATQFGRKSFNLDVPERTKCLEELLTGKIPNIDEESASVKNLVARYRQAKEEINEAIDAKQLLMFADWLTEKVQLVEICAGSSNDAYVMFETMNDRGLRLTSAEMLKGYLLSEIRDETQRKRANDAWRKNVDALVSKNKDDDSNAIKAWLRGQHADTMSPDFDAIGAQFHRWVRSNKTKLGLVDSASFAGFIERDFNFYARQFSRLREAANDFNSALQLQIPEVFYLAQQNFTLQYTLLLSVVRPQDSDDDISKKLRVVAAYLDIAIHRRIGNGRKIAESSMRAPIFKIVQLVRNKPADEIAEILTAALDKEADEWEFLATLATDFALHGNNRPGVHRILARITDYIDTQSGLQSRFTDYFASDKKHYQIEHIWRNEFDADRRKEFENEYEFDGFRNRIGGLLLLHNKLNNSFGDKPYSEKYELYGTLPQDMLSKSLHEGCYQSNPGFRQFADNFCTDTEVQFKHHPKFNKDDLEQRQKLYIALADEIWHPRRLNAAV